VNRAEEEEIEERRESYEIDLPDGVYRGEGEGFGGKLVLDVTIDGGKISELKLSPAKRLLSLPIPL